MRVTGAERKGPVVQRQRRSGLPNLQPIVMKMRGACLVKRRMLVQEGVQQEGERIEDPLVEVTL